MLHIFGRNIFLDILTVVLVLSIYLIDSAIIVVIFIRKEIYMTRKVSNTRYARDCSPKGIARRAVQVYKMSDAKNPVKTGNRVVDFATGRLPLVKDWNKGFNLGKLGFVAQ